MLNNNAELDNGVYNDNDEDDKPAGKKEDDDGLVGLNQQIQSEPTEEHHVEDQATESKPPSAPASYLQSLNTSQEILDDDKIEQMHQSFRYPPEHTRQQLLDDKLNHCTTTYFLMD